MPENPPQDLVAAQLYTLREFTKTPQAIAATLERVRKLGYRAVQLSALGPIDTAELRGLLDREGLTACATHTPWQRLQDDLDRVIEEHRLLDCEHCAIPSLPEAYRDGGGYARFAREASRIGAELGAAGLTLSYHNHDFELERVDGRRTGLEVLIEESDPSGLGFEIDTYWIQNGGGDPAEWLARVSGRAPLLHLKDMAVVSGKPEMAEVGEGNLAWSRLLETARSSGVEWYIVEQDFCRGDPFDSLATSLGNLATMGVA